MKLVGLRILSADVEVEAERGGAGLNGCYPTNQTRI